MSRKVFALDTLPGIQRDGTVFDRNYYVDGRWVRFQRGRPRKMGGYREIVNNLAGPSRGLYVNPQNNFNNVYSGYNNGLQLVPIDNNGVGAGVTDITLTGFTPNVNNMWQFDTYTDTNGSGNQLLLAHPGQNLTDINNSVETPVLGNVIGTTTASPIGVFTIAATLNSTTTVTVASTTQIGAGQTVTGTGIPANTTVTVVNNSKKGNYLMCAGCRTPIKNKDIKSPKYEKDVSCPNCFDKLTDKQKFRFRMRASQKISGKLKSNSLQRASA